MLDQVLTYVNKNKLNNLLNIIDLRQSMMTNKNNFSDLYYKTDTHWNQLGAFVAHTQLINTLKQEFNNLPNILSMTDFTITKNRINGDLADMLAIKLKSDNFDFKPNFEQIITTKMLDKQSFQVFNKTTDSTRTAMIYRDSFFNVLHPFTSHYFKQVDYIYDKVRSNDLEQIIAQKPDVVILETIERKV